MDKIKKSLSKEKQRKDEKPRKVVKNRNWYESNTCVRKEKLPFIVLKWNILKLMTVTSG